MHSAENMTSCRESRVSYKPFHPGCVIFAATVKKSIYTYGAFEWLSAMFMVASLVWLTISAPIVFNAQQHAAAQQASLPDETEWPEDDFPLSNSTEEKSPGNPGVQEEYLHDEEDNLLLCARSLKHARKNPPAVYFAYHGELLSPPPEVKA